LVSICSIGTAPFGSGMYTYASANSIKESYGYADYVMKILDPVKGQLIISAILVIYAAFIAPKLAPNQPSVPVTLGSFKNKAGAVDDTPPLDPVREVLGYGIFLLTTIGLIFADTLGLQSWQIAVTGAALITAAGVLKTQEAIDAIPVPTMLMLVAAYAAGGAMEACGLGDMIGNLLAGALGNTRNGYVIGFAFFIVPFILTQFMQNFSVDNLFQPIIIMASKALGCNPVGLLLILGSACNSAFMTPMSTGTIPPMMEAGGYSQKDLFKMGWLPSILMCILSVFVIMTVFPAFP
ncbi:SLC13 family permease, partial [Hungatella effluvii]|uniref:SLC13 family permease n=1 Tax=Hungatella effluvii TaxID=1096246 RepID=UPI002A7EAEB4